jgi:hypothetical protein
LDENPLVKRDLSNFIRFELKFQKKVNIDNFYIAEYLNLNFAEKEQIMII